MAIDAQPARIQQYSVAAARNRLTQLVHEVEGGETAEITRRGRPVAVLVSVKEYERLTGPRPGFWDLLTRFRASSEGVDLDAELEVLERGRDRSPGRRVAL